MASLTATNIRADELIMDIRGGGRDSRYYCLPPYRGTTAEGTPAKSGGGGYPFHLVAQGHVVGIFDDWVEAKASLSGYPDSSNRGYYSVEECIEGWQKLCALGIHPHPVDPSKTRAPSVDTSRVNTSPRKPQTPGTSLVNTSPRKPRTPGTTGFVKQERAEVGTSTLELKRLCTPQPPPTPAPAGGTHEFVNFAIRGGGIVSSSAVRTEERYRELQRRGEEPDLLVTHSFQRASRFALEDGEGEQEGTADVLRKCNYIEIISPKHLGCTTGVYDWAGMQIVMLMVRREFARAASTVRNTNMPRAGTAARRRAREGLPPTKPGPKGWVFGTKKVLFELHKNDFLAAAEGKSTGAFYRRVGHLYIEKYGWNLAWHKDIKNGGADGDDRDADDEDADRDADADTDTDADADGDADTDGDEVDPQVEEARAAYFKKLCGVKIGVWYNTQYGSLIEKKTKPIPFTTLFDKPELEPPAPVKKRVLHYYSRHFYAERVKARVAARWAVLSRRENPPKMITVRNTVTREAWLSETQAFRDEVILALEKEHQNAIEAYSKAVSGAVPNTPAEYDIALNNAAYYLQPFTDAIHERFGMNVCLLLCGPIPDRGGRIEVRRWDLESLKEYNADEGRSIHSGTSNGLVPRIWSDFDRAGFDSAQRSLVEFTHHCFTEEECRARAVDRQSASGAPSDDEGAPDDLIRGTTPPVPNSTTPSATRSSTPATTSPVSLPASASSTTPPAPGSTTPAARPMTSWMTPVETPLDANEGGFAWTEEELAMLVPEMMSKEELERMLFDPSAFNEDGSLRKGLGFEGGMLFENEEPEGAFAHIAAPILQENPHGAAEVAPLVIREALRVEMAAMAPEAAADYMRILQSMSVQSVEWENEIAEDRATTRDVAKGITEVRDEAEGGGSGGKDGAERDDVRKKAAAERPKPKPAYRGAVSLPTLERPEANPDAEGPLNAEDGQRTSARGEGEADAGEKDQDGGEEAKDGGEGEAEGRPWKERDMSMWPEELQSAYKAFGRARDWGGEDWVTCVDAFLTLERLHGFRAKGVLAVPNGKADERPREVPDWMQARRRWEKPVEMTSTIGPAAEKGSFADRWWDWWFRAQPTGRVQASGKLMVAERVPARDWEDVSKMVGRNGLLLYVGGLLWWGEAAAAAAAEERELLLKDWRVAVEDVREVLESAAAFILTPSEIPTKGKAQSKKRKSPPGGQEKENTEPAPRKRRKKN
ncbi:hypothetical protein C8F04DRAFT_1184373 [Mycena alexandri]|uniref:Uncharacterized protein n=1 Tax=Mycena alexandri TaxID=1745969 RepID=A0AAD6WZC3_9AGAR|nr:hypothetical protein C8F04DRAFT_1184373 [Mycena alexandri]